MKMTIIIIIIIIIIARFSKIQIHWKSIKKVKLLTEDQSWTKAFVSFWSLDRTFLKCKNHYFICFFYFGMIFLTAFCVWNSNRVLKHNVYKQVRNKILVLISLVITSMAYNFLCHHHSWEHDKGTDNYQCCHVSHRPSL